jgi:hypothetical protein
MHACARVLANLTHRQVKNESATSPDDVTAFYTSRGIDQTVLALMVANFCLNSVVDLLGHVILSDYGACLQDLANQYVSSSLSHAAFRTLPR